MTQMLLIFEQLFSLPTQAQTTLLYDTNYTTLWDRTALYTTLQFASGGGAAGARGRGSSAGGGLLGGVQHVLHCRGQGRATECGASRLLHACAGLSHAPVDEKGRGRTASESED
jgi:hypothetical protein